MLVGMQVGTSTTEQEGRRRREKRIRIEADELIPFSPGV
jgi:hypothetical protein